MIEFSKVVGVTIPEGEAVQIANAAGTVLWTGYRDRYVSLGDSIAAGHAINENWATGYGEGSQYGKNGNTETAIVPGCYTDLIRTELATRASNGRVKATSFARSGDTVADLIAKLSQSPVVTAITPATLITICIGANDVLQTAMSHLEEYIMTGDLSTIEAEVEANLVTLNTDSAANSYRALFERITELNPRATVVFTTVYNPYKYLWIEEGSNGFFKPMLDTIPEMSLFGFRVDTLIKDTFLSAPLTQQLFSRINGLGSWAENYVTQLDNILTSKVNSYKSVNANFAVANTKALYDGVPDRVISAQKHYNDLVNVEYTRGYNTMSMDWGRLYEGTTASAYWWALANKYVSTSGIDVTGYTTELVSDIVTRVIVPDVDPHPESYGHYALKRSFADTLGWQALDRHTVSYQANGGTGTTTPQTALGMDGLAAYLNLRASGFTPATGYYFTGWQDAEGTSYAAGQWVGVAADLTLSAQWSNIYIIRYDAYESSALLGDSDTGRMDYYGLAIGGELKPKFGQFSNPDIYYQVPYGTHVVVLASDAEKNNQSYVTLNGATVAGKSNQALYEFDLTSSVRIRFEANKYYSGLTLHEYWNCYITTM